jgi:hypothetical protein
VILRIRNLCRINTPGFVRFPDVLLQIIVASLEQDDKLAHIFQIHPDADTVQRHLADIGAHVQNSGIFNLDFYSFYLFRRKVKFQFLIQSAYALLASSFANEFSKSRTGEVNFPCPTHILFVSQTKIPPCYAGGGQIFR